MKASLHYLKVCFHIFILTSESPNNSDFSKNPSVYQRLFSLLKTITMEINSSKMIKTTIMSKNIELITLKRKGQFYKVVKIIKDMYPAIYFPCNSYFYC